MESLSKTTCMAPFKNGLREGPLNGNLTRHSAETMDEIQVRVRNYILEEEDNKHKKKRDEASSSSKADAQREMANRPVQRYVNPQPTRHNQTAPYQPHAQPDRAGATTGNQAQAHPRPAQQVAVYNAEGEKDKVILNAPLAEILKEATHLDLVTYPRVSGKLPTTIDPTKRCLFHRAVGHNTEECWTLRRDVERLVRSGWLLEFVAAPTREMNPVLGDPISNICSMQCVYETVYTLGHLFFLSISLFRSQEIIHDIHHLSLLSSYIFLVVYTH